LSSVTTWVTLDYLHDLVLPLLDHRRQVDLDDAARVQHQPDADVRGVQHRQEVSLEHVVLADQLSSRHPLRPVHPQPRKLAAELSHVFYKPERQFGGDFNVEGLEVEVFC
jgi:hypothetical protein